MRGSNNNDDVGPTGLGKSRLRMLWSRGLLYVVTTDHLFKKALTDSCCDAIKLCGALGDVEQGVIPDIAFLLILRIQSFVILSCSVLSRHDSVESLEAEYAPACTTRNFYHVLLSKQSFILYGFGFSYSLSAALRHDNFKSSEPPIDKAQTISLARLLSAVPSTLSPIGSSIFKSFASRWEHEAKLWDLGSEDGAPRLCLGKGLSRTTSGDDGRRRWAVTSFWNVLGSVAIEPKFDGRNVRPLAGALIYFYSYLNPLTEMRVKGFCSSAQFYRTHSCRVLSVCLAIHVPYVFYRKSRISSSQLTSSTTVLFASSRSAPTEATLGRTPQNQPTQIQDKEYPYRP
ncbi:uncharacterized protein BDR25DRAFT_396168 [Lindgomyces ingoldianus]|uniref:Uncharacterized protein n=1 Tax=Lindgomyces ingoldianus TaxID=673940 RepID=A0ACB6QEX1_9PLEO|nr:uncharacterized protein BDR25DRAFT_396168 [Lindgomyces ingoldianus]KAF2465459.1 hypothetical protein BDR25DRAFT_396168 [Lindgomyces ingoldianus]